MQLQLLRFEEGKKRIGPSILFATWTLTSSEDTQHCQGARMLVYSIYYVWRTGLGVVLHEE
jgi:hypothetical protein